MKKCCRCKTLKDKDSFSADRRSSTGLKSHCKICERERLRLWRRGLVGEKKLAFLEQRRLGRIKNIVKARSSRKTWGKGNREKHNAHKAVARAVRSGKLIRLPCAVCGASDLIHGHHDDYLEPLKVVWLCPRHHADRHRATDNHNER